MGKKCAFCRIYGERSEQVLHVNKYFFVSLDAFPVSPGHTEIIPKRHIPLLSDLINDEWSQLQPTYLDVLKLIERTDFKKLYENLVKNPINESSEWFCKKMLQSEYLGKKPDAYNVGINEGRAAGRTVDHLHIHVIPRYFGDVLDPRGGVRHIIPWMGYY